MRIQISNKQLQLIQEALKDEIPQYMQDIIQKRYGEKYLDMDVPEHSPIIPEITKEVVDEELGEEIYKRILENFHSKINEQWMRTKLFEIYGYNAETAMSHPSSEENNALRTRILLFKMALNGGKPVSESDSTGSGGTSSSLLNPKKFYSNNFTLLQSKNNNIENPIFSKNTSNLYNFLISAKRAFPTVFYDVDPASVVNDKIFMGLRNPILNSEETLRKIKQGKLYLHISSKPYDILRMSVSDFYDSCQNIYTGGVHGTEFNKKLLSNVFDKNSKVAFLLYDAPFTDKMGNKHPNSPIARMIIRTTPKGAILFDKVYPGELGQKMYKIVTDLTGLQNTGNPGDVYHYTNIEGLPEPYMDRYKLINTQPLSKPTNKRIILAKHLNININKVNQVNESYFYVEIRPSVMDAYQVFTESEADEYLRDDIHFDNQLFLYLDKASLEDVLLKYKVIPFMEFKTTLSRQIIDFIENTPVYGDQSLTDLQEKIKDLYDAQKLTTINSIDYNKIKNNIQKLKDVSFAEYEKLKNDDRGFLKYLEEKYKVTNLNHLKNYKNSELLDHPNEFWVKYELLLNHVKRENLIKLVHGNKLNAINKTLNDTSNVGGFIVEKIVDNNIYYIYKMQK